MSQVKAEYSMRDDGGVRVINSGFDNESQSWQEAIGRAYFVGEPATTHLKVSFFGPFYGSYVIYQLDTDYQYAFVSGNSTDYLWLLSRTPTISQEVKDVFLRSAKEKEFDVTSLIWMQP